MQGRVPLPEHVGAAFTEVAQGSRLLWHTFHNSGDPSIGSNFAQANELYPFEKVSDRARHYVAAAFEHLLMWADFAAPFKFHVEQSTTFTMRPTYVLARASLESAAQAVWLLDTRDPVECVRRHLRLIRWDLEEHRKSRPDEAGKAEVRARDAALLSRVAAVFPEEELRPPQGYLWVIQQACQPPDLEVDKAEAEKYWRMASGAAHGMYWTNLELNNIDVGEEYEPGHFRTTMLPDPDAMVRMLNISFKVTQYAALKYLGYAGVDIASRLSLARRWLAEEITLRPGTDPEVRRQLAGDAAPLGEA